MTAALMASRPSESISPSRRALQMRGLDQNEELVDRLDVHGGEHAHVDAEAQGGKRVQGLLAGDEIGVLQDAVGASDMVQEEVLALVQGAWRALPFRGRLSGLSPRRAARLSAPRWSSRRLRVRSANCSTDPMLRSLAHKRSGAHGQVPSPRRIGSFYC